MNIHLWPRHRLWQAKHKKGANAAVMLDSNHMRLSISRALNEKV